MDNKKKILILVDWFVPGFKAGGPIQSCVNICKALKNEYKIYVLTTDTDHGEKEPYKGITCNTWIYNNELEASIYYLQKKALKAAQIVEQIAFVDAHFIYLNHLFSPYFVVFPLWLKYTNRVGGKFVVCPRGALYGSALSLKSYKKKPLLYLYQWMGIHKQITFHATNERELTAIKKYFPGSEVMVADNLPDTNQPPFVSCKKVEEKLDCIFIARIVPIKNLLFLLQLLQQLQEMITLTIVGPVEDEAYWQDCKRSISLMPVNITVNYLGAKPNSELSALIQQHHLFILPTKGENFGHSIFEALLCGRPVLISDQTPWLNLEAQNAGWDLPLTAHEKFEDIIRKLAACNQEQFDTCSKGAWQYSGNFIHHTVAIQQYFNLFT